MVKSLLLTSEWQGWAEGLSSGFRLPGLNPSSSTCKLCNLPQM